MQKDFAINDNHSHCSVRLEYANGIIIERARKRGKTESLKTYKRDPVTGAEVYQPEKELGELRHTQRLLNDALGIDYETFSKSVVLGQNIFNNFVSGSKEQRRTIIEEMLGLDKFNVYFEVCKAERTDLEARIALVTSKLSDARREVELFGNQVTVLGMSPSIFTSTSISSFLFLFLFFFFFFFFFLFWC
jgi:DNA repair exonuclease SbcCD ATPase subunit